jgi:tripartite-type tricarboxylate transporter receptor subunit TctC
VFEILKTLCLVVAFAGVSSDLHAADGPYPNRLVRITVPFTPGTSPDVVIRMIVAKLSADWGQPVVVDNRPGAAGAIGAQRVARSDPDGYSILYTINSVICANPHLYPKLPYDVFRDFKPVSIVISLGYVLMTRADSPLTTLQQTIAYAKANPGKLNYGSAGAGTGNHIVMELLSSMAGISMTHIPANADPSLSLLTSQTDLVFSPFTNALAMVKGGKVRALAVTSPTREPAMPDVPTVREVVPGFEADAWQGLFVPSGTPQSIVDKLSADVHAALQNPEIQARLTEMGLHPVGDTPQEAEKIVRSDFDKWGRVIRAAKIQVE